MNFHRVHTRVSAIDTDRNRFMTLESFNHITWSFYDDEREFHFVFEADSYNDARWKAKLRYFNWLLSKGENP